jgi:hypothetical protein
MTTLHVLRDGLHRLSDVFTEACLSADREDGHHQPLGRALLVLCDGGIERPVPPEAAAQGVGVGEHPDVVVDHVVGDLGGCVELPAVEGVLPSRDELFIQLVDPVEAEVPEPVVEWPREEQGGA